MSTLANIQENLDRSIFKAVDTMATTNGFAVNRAANNILTTKSVWDAAEAAIITSKGFVVSIFGTSAPKEKFEKKVPRIVITPDRINPGDLGNKVTPSFKLNTSTGVYDKHHEPLQTSDYTIKVHLSANTVASYRVLHNIVNAALSHKNHLPFYDAPNNHFMILNLGFFDNPNNSRGLYEGHYSFTIPDILETELKVSQGTIGKINEIKVDLNGELLNTIN